MGSEPGIEVWDDTIRHIVAGGGVVLLIGAPDTGKTTFCCRAANAAIEAGRRVAIVDGDIGQSEIGPPACVSMAVPEAPFARMSDLPPVRSAFVGTISPRYAAIEHLAAFCRTVYAARSMDVDLVLCDTTGYVQGPAAQRLKSAKAVALRPEHVVRLTRRAVRQAPGPEAEREVRRTPGPTAAGNAPAPQHTHTLPVPACIALKPPMMRAQRREYRFLKAIENSVIREFPLESVRMQGTWIGSGAALSATACAQLSRALRTSVRYAETRPGHLGAIVASPPRPELADMACRELYGADYASITLEANLGDLLVGLNDAAGDMLSLGRLAELDYAGRILRIATPTLSYALVREVRFGLTRVDAQGRVLASLRPGDV